MPNIAVHTFSSEGTSSNNSKTRNRRQSVSITTVTTKDDFKKKMKGTRIKKIKSYRYIPHQ